MFRLVSPGMGSPISSSGRGKKNIYSVPTCEVDFTPVELDRNWHVLRAIFFYSLWVNTPQGPCQQGSATPLPASSAAVLLDSCSSPAASNSLTKFEGNTPDLPLELPLHQPSSTCEENSDFTTAHLVWNVALSFKNTQSPLMHDESSCNVKKIVCSYN